jgi:putative ABC transport system substrate-binding protein
MNSRRKFIVAIGCGALAASLRAFGQQTPTKIPRIGYLHTASPPSDGVDWRLSAFQDGLRELGYIDGKTIRLEVRWGEGKLERMSALAAELVQLNVDIIVAGTAPSVLAARQATLTIPIVMPVSSDPVGDGLVKSLAHPGGNITGLSLMSPELGAKRLQLLKELLPKVVHPVAVLWNPAYVGMRTRFEQAQSAAPAVGITVRSMEVRDLRELETAFDAIIKDRSDALLLLADPFTGSQRRQIVEFAAQKRLPAIYESSEFVDAGGLMSYGPSIAENYRRAAYYVGKILKGAKPADLPIEQPTKFELIVNMKTARALGIKIPDSIMVQATKVIE